MKQRTVELTWWVEQRQAATVEAKGYDTGVPGLLIARRLDDGGDQPKTGRFLLVHEASGLALSHAGFDRRQDALGAAADLEGVADWTAPSRTFGLATGEPFRTVMRVLGKWGAR